jgi:ribosomal protein L11 methyltransferase
MTKVQRMETNYSRVLISGPNLTAENLYELEQLAFADFNCEGVEESNLLESEVDEILGERAFCGGELPLDVISDLDREAQKNKQKKIFYFNSITEGNLFKEFVNENFTLTVESTEEANKDWNIEWKKHFKPIKVSDTLWIKPSFYLDNKPTDVIINPGMGFGTGSHETTYLCLKIFNQLLKDSHIGAKDCVLDFGCGSGILGIAARKISSNLSVEFMDIDRDALRNCTENIMLNFPNEDLSRLKIVARDRFVYKKFSFIFANILLNVLKLETDTLLECSSPNTYILFSGILTTQIEELKSHYAKVIEYKIITEEIKGDWAALLIQIQ